MNYFNNTWRLLLWTIFLAFIYAAAIYADNKKEEFVTVAAGCFWSVELAFQRVPGVTKTEVGYTGGGHDSDQKEVTYERVLTGKTGHAESVRIHFDPNLVSASDLYRLFFDIHDPTTLNKQGGDVGTQYRSAIFYHHDKQMIEAKNTLQYVKSKLKMGQTIVTEIVPAKKWWPAEDYHQRYLEKGGQDATKSSTEPIQCYGNRGPIKYLSKILSDDAMNVLKGNTSPKDL